MIYPLAALVALAACAWFALHGDTLLAFVAAGTIWMVYAAYRADRRRA